MTTNLTSTEDNKGNVINYTYDALDRLLSQTQAPSGISYSYKYDGLDAYAHSNPLGNLTFSTNNNSSAGSSYSYDSMNRVVNENKCVPGNCTFGTSGINIGATYNYEGEMTSLTYPDGRVVEQSYDGAGRLSSVNYASWGGVAVGTSYWSASAFAPPGEVVSAGYGNGVSVASAFNSRQSVTSLTYSNGNGPMWSRQYVWDKNAQNLLFETNGNGGGGRQFSYDTLDRIVTAQDFSTASNGTGSVTVSGFDQIHRPTCLNCGSIYDRGDVAISVDGGVVAESSYGQGSTASSIASALGSYINSNQRSPVTATVSGSTLTLTSKVAGASSNYSLSTTAETSYPQYFSDPSFILDTSGSSLSGGGVTLAPNGLNEAYNYDAFGNLTQAGTFSFSQSFNPLNQINGYNYDADGNQTTDINGNSLAFDANGMLSSVAGGAETYTYDGEGNRVEVHGAAVTDYLYFGGVPIAILNGASYSDLIYVGGSLIAEVPGTQSGAPVYRALNRLGSLAGNPDSSGLSGAMSYAPYGQVASGTNSDPFGFSGLQWDSTTQTYHADFRQFSIQQGRWQSPDPYQGSYDLADPQTLNRYAYVIGRAMWATDPSGLDGGPPPVGPPGYYPLKEVADLIVGLLNRSSFHGSLEKRPSAGPWNDNFGVPYGGLTNGIQQALGLPTGGCEFGACGDSGMNLGQNPDGSDTSSSQLPTLIPVVYYNGRSFNVGMTPPSLPDPRKVCVNKFESSLDGRFYNFWSLAAPLIGPDRIGSAKEDTLGVGSKYLAVKWFQHLGYEDFVRLVKGVAGKGLLPLSIAATVGQVTGHVGCQFATE